VFAVGSTKAFSAFAHPQVANSMPRAKVEVKTGVSRDDLVGDAALTAEGGSNGHKLTYLGNPAHKCCHRWQ
jgi:hypothetical protein